MTKITKGIRLCKNKLAVLLGMQQVTRQSIFEQGAILCTKISRANFQIAASIYTRLPVLYNASKRIKGLDLKLEYSCCTSLMLLADRVRLIVQGNYNRPAHHRPDLESKEEIFQHKMQAYDKVVFTEAARTGQKWPEAARTGEKWPRVARSGQE